MAQQKSVGIIKKKKWYQIMAPRLFDYPIAETPAYDSKSLVGRAMYISLMNLTNDPKRQNMNIKFLVTSFTDNAANAEAIGYYITPSSLKRLIRRGADRVDDSIKCETIDNLKIKVKTFMITRSIVKASIRTHIRRVARDYIVKYAKKTSLVNLISDIVSYKLQSELRDILKKVYPLRTIEIRSLELVKDPNDERTIVEIVKLMENTQKSEELEDQAKSSELKE